MKKRMWIFVLAAVLLVSVLAPIGLNAGNDQSGAKTVISSVNEYEEIQKAYGSENAAQSQEYAASVVQPALTLKAPTLEFKDMITVNAMFTAENIQDVVEMGMITYSSKVDAWSVETAEHVIPGTTYDEVTGRYIACSQGIHAKYLGDTVYLAAYAKLADGTYAYSKLAGYSPVQYAASKLKGTDVPLKQLVVAMLNYGAAAQVHFNHNVGNLANATLTAEQIALSETYRSDMVSTVASPSQDKQGAFYNNKGFAKRYPSISFEGAFCINYFFTPNYAPDNGITLYFWNAKDYDAVSALTTANASGSMKLEGSGTGEYRGDITGIAAKALSEAVYVAAVYENNGTTWTSGVLGYSIGAYCASQSTKGGTIADLAMATAVYGYQAREYFGVQTPPAVTTYTVTFKDWDGKVLKTQTVEVGQSATAPTDPSREGYTFSGWDKNFSAVTSNLTVTATYTKNALEKYAVTFVDFDGKTLATESVNSGTAAKLPANPSKSGATFLGWSGNYVNVTQDETVTAVYDDTKNVFIIESVTGSVGDTITVLVTVDGNVKTCAFDMDLYFDPALELVGYDDDLQMSIIVNDAIHNNGIKMNFSDAKDKTKQREIIELTLRIKDTSKTALPIWIEMKEVFEIMDSGAIVESAYTIIDGVVMVQ